MISTRSVGLVIDTVVCLTLDKWETVSGQFGGYLSRSSSSASASISSLTRALTRASELMLLTAHVRWLQTGPMYDGNVGVARFPDFSPMNKLEIWCKKGRRLGESPRQPAPRAPRTMPVRRVMATKADR
jgi:hypothetical protein